MAEAARSLQRGSRLLFKLPEHVFGRRPGRGMGRRRDRRVGKAPTDEPGSWSAEAPDAGLSSLRQRGHDLVAWTVPGQRW